MNRRSFLQSAIFGAFALAVKPTYASSLFTATVASSGGGAPAPPTYATWDAANKGSAVVLSGDLLGASQAGTNNTVFATIGISSGKVCWEITLDAATGNGVHGVGASGANLETWLGSDAWGWGYYTGNGNLYGSGSNPLWAGVPYGAGAVLTFYLDMDAGTLGIKLNGTDYGIAFTGLTGTIFPACTVSLGGVVANFGQSALTYPVAGYAEGVFT